jgi:5-methylcytosine-specific restriction enzyme B
MVRFKGKNITKEDIIKVLEEFDRRYPDTNDYENWLYGNQYKFALIYNGKKYPPKYILSKVSGISTDEFSGGPNTNRIFESLGFQIESKTQSENEQQMIGSDDVMNFGEKQRLINEKYNKYRDQGRIEFITFHPAYSYEEFIEGITVDTGSTDTEIKYILKEGMFKELSKRALGSAMGLERKEIENKRWKDVFIGYMESKEDVDFNEADKYVLIIDEINRGDIAKVFGELITLLEADKRISEENELIVKLPLSGDQFGVPPNLFIVATMNTADRSIAMLDIALRRRFGFIQMSPDFNIIREKILTEKKDELQSNGVYDLLNLSILAVEKVNKEICKDKSLGIDKKIGHSFFFKVSIPEDLIMVWRHEILPLLEEYCYSDYAKINKLLFGKEIDSEYISEDEGIIDLNNANELNRMLEKIIGNE